MKMITAIVNKKDAAEVCDALAEERFSFTKMATTGGFLKSGNVTLLMGVEDEKVEAAIEIIRKHCAQRMEPMPSVVGAGVPAFSYYKAEVLVGGATVFVSPVERFEKM
ncbi:MAG: cyclic-di-AMP receptor [Clostridia bacterium]|nr:cyclic-di-AMP receptor [Clostridia bacterium]